MGASDGALLRPYDPQADAAGSSRELFDLYQAAKATQWQAEKAGLLKR
jgi:hypothetical protein